VSSSPHDCFALSVIRGLSDRPRWLSCRYLYDAEGSALFEAITAQPEYYPTRTEAEILASYASTIHTLAPVPTLVELGAGSAVKTRHLLQAWTGNGTRPRYVPVDISATALQACCAALADEHPGLRVEGIAASFEHAFPRLRELSPLVLLFLGSTVGNLNEAELHDFLVQVAASLGPEDYFLLGVDLVKDVAALEAAYNDAAGVSAAFTKNIFARMNRDLGTALDLDHIEHEAHYQAARERIEIFARFDRRAIIDLPRFGRRFEIAAGERIMTEISRKFRPDTMAAEIAAHGFTLVRTFTDPACQFALLLFRRDAAVARDGWKKAASTMLVQTRARTLELVGALTDAQLSQQHSVLMSPIVWDLGHIASYEEEWIVGGACGRGSLYDPIAHPRAERGRLPLPDRTAASAELTAVRQRTLACLHGAAAHSDDPLFRQGYVFGMVAQHEAQHTETILQTVQLIADLRYEPGWREDPPGAAVPLDSEMVLVPTGAFPMGTDDRTSAYDNERPAHEVFLDAYRIDVAPVTNRQFLRFVTDDGYRRRDLWDEAGWYWRTQHEIAHPAQWRRQREGWYEQAFGRLTPLALDRPVIHVSWFEATAYARWAGKRLPTEAEWEKAAAWDPERELALRYPWGAAPPTSERANLDQRTFAPAPIGAYPRGRSFYGCHQMIGCVWEWTASEFLPYPGFAPFPYPEYSAVHMQRGYRVLRGGSWATQPIAIRNTFRNWDLPERRQIFAGLRCAVNA